MSPQRRVLVIDDDEVSLEVLSALLAASGFEVQTAGGGEDGLDRLRRPGAGFDVVLADTLMPGLSGLPLLSALRAHGRARLIGMSGSYPPEEVLRATDGFLLKPFAIEELEALLASGAAGPGAAAVPGGTAGGGPARKPGGSGGRQKSMSAAAGEPGRPGPPVEPGPPVLDRAIFARLRAMMPAAALGETYAACLADLERRSGEMKEAAAAGDAARLRQSAHASKGSCGFLGASELAALAAALESGGNKQDDWAQLLRQFDLARERLKGMLGAEFDTGIRQTK